MENKQNWCVYPSRGQHSWVRGVAFFIQEHRKLLALLAGNLPLSTSHDDNGRGSNKPTKLLVVTIVFTAFSCGFMWLLLCYYLLLNSMFLQWWHFYGSCIYGDQNLTSIVLLSWLIEVNHHARCPKLTSVFFINDSVTLLYHNTCQLTYFWLG